MSLSARRAWIEINTRNQPGKPKAVALRKESVDRNPYLLWQFGRAFWSLSARRAWIEMPAVRQRPGLPASLSARRAWIEIIDTPGIWLTGAVALRKESVDRNHWKAVNEHVSAGRSPQGERG